MRHSFGLLVVLLGAQVACAPKPDETMVKHIVETLLVGENELRMTRFSQPDMTGVTIWLGTPDVTEHNIKGVVTACEVDLPFTYTIELDYYTYQDIQPVAEVSGHVVLDSSVDNTGRLLHLTGEVEVTSTDERQKVEDMELDLTVTDANTATGSVTANGEDFEWNGDPILP